MKKRIALMIGLACMVMIAGGALFIVYVCRDPINQAASDKIREGMTETEIIAMFGRPCDDLSTVAATRYVHNPTDGTIQAMRYDFQRKSWTGASGSVLVDYDESGKFFASSFLENENSILIRIRRMLYPEEVATVYSPPLMPSPQISVRQRDE